jgi:hypothetical protein
VFSLRDEHRIFLRTIFSPAIDAAARRLLIQMAGFAFNEYREDRWLRAQHPLESVHFEFDVDLARLVKYHPEC